MVSFVSDLITAAARRTPTAPALQLRQTCLSYRELDLAVDSFAAGLRSLDPTLNTDQHPRVAVYLPKQLETVIALFGASRAGAVFVPINSVLKSLQVEHILRDCNVRVLVTSADRLATLQDILPRCNDLQHIVLVDDTAVTSSVANHHSTAIATHHWREFQNAKTSSTPRAIDSRGVDIEVEQPLAAILYTSGSTGSPKGVMFSHRNLLIGAASVAQYLDNRAEDRLLAVLPLSFDYGLSQLTTAFTVGACVVLLDHLFARDVIAAVAQERITGLAAVPPLWSQLAVLPWPTAATQSLRYITNSGGAMPGVILDKLRASLPTTRVFLMYGLTEAFRATYLPPEQLEQRPNSIGKAIPNAIVDVLRPDGSYCEVDEPGELVQRGALVTLGYWNAPETTAQRFRLMPNHLIPNQSSQSAIPEIAVWSGDTVKRDSEGYLYFIARNDEQIKTSGYRVSPTEVENIVLASGFAKEVVAVGIPHTTLGQVIAVVATRAQSLDNLTSLLESYCRQQMPTYMVPSYIEWRDELPRNANGKYDRALLARELSEQSTSITL